MSIADGYSPCWADRPVPAYTRSHAAALTELRACQRQFENGTWSPATAWEAGRLQTRIPILEDEVLMAYATENPDWKGITKRQQRTIRVVSERREKV